MRTQIIAEIASCHNGDIELAGSLIRAAAENGADIVKFQDWRASNVKKDDPDKARYTRYQFPDAWYRILIPYCQEQGVEFLTTVFNKDRVEFLAGLGLKRIKLASISLTNAELIMEAGLHFDEVIASTGMHSREEIEEAADLLASNCKKFTMMHCVANYPMAAGDANLARIDELKKIVEGQEYASVGYSDHSLYLPVAKMAMSKGIKYIEKHFSLSRYLPQTPHRMYEGGPMVTTHEVSIEPHELRQLANWRDEFEIINGSGEFKSNETEEAIRARYSRRYGV